MEAVFAEKLDYVMKLTGTKASSLGDACHIAPAHVSRLRTGGRNLPKKPAFLHAMCQYLARRVTDTYQQRALCEAMHLSQWPAGEEAAAALEGWFLGESATSPDIAPLLAKFSNPKPGPVFAPAAAETLPAARSYYYGPKGKQEAVLQFFDLILRQKTPQTLYLVSEEEMGWLYEDPAFSALWLDRFTRVIAAGNKVKIIHSIGRGINEMLEAVGKWLPVYTTGAVEPYYYSKLRDGIFQRTLFIAPRTAAVASTSLLQKSQGRLHFFVTDPDALAALSREFDDYLSLCQPLMQIITLANRTDLWQVYHALLAAPGGTVFMSDRPSLMTMPQQVAKALAERAPESDILKEWRAATGVLKHLRPGEEIVEIVPAQFEPSTAQVAYADLLGAPGLAYTVEEWQSHVDNALRFAQRHPGYRRVVREGLPRNICLLAKEGRGVVLIKPDAPGVAFAFSENNMVNSFWDYLSKLI